MARRNSRKIGLLSKIETTYGVDATPTGANNAIIAINPTLTPIEGQEISRELLFPYLGNPGIILTGTYAKLEFSVEVAGAGAAGTAPKWGPLLRGCGWSETVNAGTSVVYAPVSSGLESLSHYFNLDGVNHVLLGSRGSWVREYAAQQIPRWRFSYSGLIGTIADTALPALTLAGFQKPLVVNKANTTVSLHGLSAIAERINIDCGNQVEPRLLIGYEGIEIVDRVMVGQAVLEADLLAAKNWFDIAQKATTGALAITHGTVAGNIVQDAAAAVQIGRPTYGDSNKIVNITLPLSIIPGASGNDEFSITVK